MIFKDTHEAKKWFLNYKEFESDVIDFWTGYDSRSWKFGDYIMFQHIQNGKISRPIYGIFSSFTIWDQALVLQYIENKRSWMYSHEIETIYEGKVYTNKVSFYDDSMQFIEFWTGNINVLGHWKNRPTISQLKSAIHKNLLPISERRDSQLHTILNV